MYTCPFYTIWLSWSSDQQTLCNNQQTPSVKHTKRCVSVIILALCESYRPSSAFNYDAGLPHNPQFTVLDYSTPFA